MNKTCSTCLCWDDFSGVCWNGESENCADFTDGDDSCKAWEKHDCEEGEDAEE